MPSIVIREADGQTRVLQSETYLYEEILKRNIAEIPHLIPLGAVTEEEITHVTIGDEWPAGLGAADIVLLGSDAILTIVETKLKRNPEARREVIAQVLEYAAYLSEWTIWEITRRADEFFRSDKAHADYRHKPFNDVLRLFLEDTDEGIESFKGKVEQNLQQGRIRLIVAVDEVGEQAQKIITFLNSFSSFEIYLLQISTYADGGRQVFVPSLYGYARKVARIRPSIEWDWDKYESELGWTKETIERVRKLHQRLVVLSKNWQPETRFNAGWTTVYCFGKSVYGVQVFKRKGLAVWFRLEQNPVASLPTEVSPRQTSSYFYLHGRPEAISEAQLQQLCETSLKQVGLEPSAE
jgi:hypothetical protein